MRTALLSNNQTAIQNSISALQAANTQLNTSDAFYGNLENQIENASTFSGNYDAQLQTEVSNLQDADIAHEAMEITQENTQLQAAFEAQGKMPTQTLFNFLG